MIHLRNILLILLAISCGNAADKETKELYSKEKMVDIYLDIRVLEAANFSSINDSTIFEKDTISYADIFKQHKVTAEKVKATHLYYLDNSEELAWIYEKVEERLHREKSKFEAEQESGQSIKEVK